MTPSQKTRLVQEAMDTGKVGLKYIRARCPFCALSIGKRNDTALSVQKDSLFYRCFRCGTYGRLPGGTDLQFPEPVEAPVEPPEGFICLGTDEGSRALSLAPARRYARSRGITPELASELSIGATIEGKFRDRLIFPMLKGQEWVGFIGRAWNPNTWMRYLYPEGMSRANMYLEYLMDEPTDEPILVVEGCMDAIAMYPRAMAVLGKPTEAHLEKLLKTKRPVIFCLDGDAWRESEACSLKLKVDGKIASGFVKLPPGYDPNEVSREWLLEECRLCL